VKKLLKEGKTVKVQIKGDGLETSTIKLHRGKS